MLIFNGFRVSKKLAIFTGISAFLAFGVFMAFQKSVKAEPDILDTIWAIGDPVAVEQGFNKFLETKDVVQDMSLYLQALSQLALTQALQKKFDAAHATLDKAEKLLTYDYKIASARILLERGRVFQQSGNIGQARNYFERAYL